MEARMTEAGNQNAVGESGVKDDIVSPVKLAHFVVRTSRYPEILDWYKTVLKAKAAFESEALAFLTYDDEHHRVAVLNIPGLMDQSEGVAGVHHIAFTYGNLTELLENYERLKTLGITPSYVINHGPTTSLYYEDPDRNQLEFQVENFDSVEESGQFFFTEAFAENPIGVEFDPDDHLRRLRAGEPEESLKRRPDIGKQTLADVKLR
jgi:catechol 2,3-dioxygenase-like lactoylglutathione lyase family enzyme